MDRKANSQLALEIKPVDVGKKPAGRDNNGLDHASRELLQKLLEYLLWRSTVQLAPGTPYSR